MAKHKKHASPHAQAAVLRIGLCGLGTVGTGVAEVIERNRELIRERAGVDLQIVRALVRQNRRRRTGAAANIPLTSKPEAVVSADDVDIVVELMGGVEPAYRLITEALRAGKPVVTANKAVLAAHGPELMRLAARHHTGLYFEGAVAGGIPIIRTLRDGLASDRITSVRGILNGTTNFILSLMEKGTPFDAALAEAQRLGYAEADPTLDITGADVADKLAILVQLAFGTAVDPANIPTEGITSLTAEVLADAKSLGYRVKLLAIAKRVASGAVPPANQGRAAKSADKAVVEEIDVRVHPAFVPTHHQLATVPDVQNAVSIVSDALGATHYQGPGAGGLPTGSAVVADLIEAARNLRAGVSTQIPSRRSEKPPRLRRADKAMTAFYVRLLVADQPGVLASVARILSACNISLATVLQHGRGDGDEPVPLVIITHPTSFGLMERALGKIKKLTILHGGLSMVPIEEPRRL